MSARRLASGGAIDRSRPVCFTFDGTHYSGFAGDTLASALLASGVRIVGRSFKYHRPRGIWGHWVEEPNAIVDLTHDGVHVPNARATTTFLEQGRVLAARAVNARPTAADDRARWIDTLSRFIPAAFYYKTFMWPSWSVYERSIRAMAGLGRIDPSWRLYVEPLQRNARCDLLVIGSGPAGLAAVRAAVAAGRSVTLVDDRPEAGGSLLFRDATIDGMAGPAWVRGTLALAERGGARILQDTTAYGVFDHNLVCLVQRGRDRNTLWRVRAQHIVLATGAIERPLVFADNDRPGVMSAEAALVYLRRYGVLVGERVMLATGNDRGYETARAMHAAGASVTVIDPRRTAGPATEGIRVLCNLGIARAEGCCGIESVVLSDGTRLDTDALLVSGGYTPTVHLFCQARGMLGWSEERQALVPRAPIAGMTVVGAANGAFGLALALTEGHEAGCMGARDTAAPRTSVAAGRMTIAPVSPEDTKGRAWLDYQSDVTTKDVRLAARESFISVEHLKRYTTLGMATDQGKTSNLNGLALLARETGRSIDMVGTTTYRPPFVPIPLPVLAGTRTGARLAPLRRLVLEPQHRRLGAVLAEYGGWLRPAFYGAEHEAAATIKQEVNVARGNVAIFDGSSLGKIEVIGPDAAAFLDFNYYNTMSTLAPGRIRYGFMLHESGVVFDDGVLTRLAPDRFVVSCSSSHVAAVHARFEEWRQDRFDCAQLFVHDATLQWVTLTVTGPRSRSLIECLHLGIDFSDAALPHMSVCIGRFADGPARVARVSFTGDRSYEVSVPAGRASLLLDQMLDAGKALGAAMLGVESLMVLRAEKGFIMVGRDTDGTTMPHDLGVNAPRIKRTGEYIGRRSLFTAAAEAPDRRQLVGLETDDLLPTGAHTVELANGKLRSIGFVTSSYLSPTLQRPIAMALVERGRSRMGERIELRHLGRNFSALIAAPCALDPEGDRLNA